MVIEATKISILDPTVQPIPESTSLAPRPTSLDGAMVGLLANGKRNSEELLRAVYSLLQDIYQFKGVVELNKGDVSRPAPKQIMDPLLEKSDLVITAIGDWGSCSSCSLHDALTVEKAGKPAACICSEPFIPTARAVAKARGIEDYPFAIVSHPIGTLEADDLMARARQALPQVLQILLGK